MVVSGEQPRNSAICIPVSILPQMKFSLLTDLFYDCILKNLGNRNSLNILKLISVCFPDFLEVCDNFLEFFLMIVIIIIITSIY